jgi:ELWxxDGT repeat protein
MVVMSDALFLSAYPRSGSYPGDFELWKIDNAGGSETVPYEPAAIIHPGGLGSTPEQLTPLGNLLFFRADDGVHGVELWAYGQTNMGGYAAWLVKDTNPDSAQGSSPKELTGFNGELVFAANRFSSSDLYKTDGTEAGTIKLADLVNPEHLTVSNDRLFFAADDGVHGRELWVSDGTADGTLMALDMNAGAPSSNPSDLTNVNGTLYFTAASSTYGRELFKLMEIDQPHLGDWMEREIIGLPPYVFKRGDRGLKNALVRIMREVDVLMSQGNIPEAVQKLQNVRRNVDGIGKNNWIIDATTQANLTRGIDGYINALSGVR